jgi:hypothetical protein
MKIKRILKWSALAILVVLFAWFEFAYWTLETGHASGKIAITVE